MRGSQFFIARQREEPSWTVDRGQGNDYSRFRCCYRLRMGPENRITFTTYELENDLVL
jgi:hypothetical protein